MSDKTGFTILEGMWFHFEIDGDQVSVHGSAWNGLEKIWVNDNLVSKMRSMTRASVHRIQVGERDLEVHFRVTDMIRAVYEVEICQDGERLRHARISYIPYDRPTWKFFVFDQWPSWKFMVFALGMGFLLGVISGIGWL